MAWTFSSVLEQGEVLTPQAPAAICLKMCSNQRPCLEGQGTQYFVGEGLNAIRPQFSPLPKSPALEGAAPAGHLRATPEGRRVHPKS